MIDQSKIRNVCIVAHIDHGKSTLADRFLEVTGAVDARDMRAQYLDSMDIERERGITIKAQNVRLTYKEHEIQLIDTPGHVDFGYEVSRSLAACEGAILLVDASQGIEAQTLANCYLALEHDLELVVALNKIDLPAADPEKVCAEIEAVLGIKPEDVLWISAKTGSGVPELLDAVIEKIPAPEGDANGQLQALMFDSYYDQYRGVVSAIRIMQGTLRSDSKMRYVNQGKSYDVEEIGIRRPGQTPVNELGPGEVGYLIAGIKDVGEARSGETVTLASNPAPALEGYLDPKPMVFCGLFPVDGDDFGNLREALEKLRLNDASYTFEPESSEALGFGFRCGFLGLLHMEIIRERLEREYNLVLVATAPNVAYFVTTNTESRKEIESPSHMPRPDSIKSIEEPYVKVTLLTPTDYVGTLMELSQERRGDMLNMTYITPERVELKYEMPLAEIVMDYFDMVKSRSKGYASLYSFKFYYC